WRVVGIEREQDCDQATHDMRVAVAAIFQHGILAAAVELVGYPDLADAAIYLVLEGVLGFRHRLQRAAELDDIAVAVVPLLQELEIVPDFLDRRHGSSRLSHPLI